MRPILLITLCIISTLGLTQSDQRIIQYLDQSWNPTKDTTNAKFYRTLEGTPGNYIVRDFYSESKIKQMEAACSSYGPIMIFNGKVSFYYDNGNIKQEEFYSNNERNGLQTSFYENGMPHRQEIISKKGFKVVQHWSFDNEPLLTNGSGRIKGLDQYDGYEKEELIKDSVIVMAYKVINYDTIYTAVEQIAEYPGGMKTFYSKVGKTMRYPYEARRSGIQGRVFMNFLVLKDGSISDVTLVKGIGGGCDEEAMRTVKALGKWNPARQNGRAVNSKFNMAMIFKLR